MSLKLIQVGVGSWGEHWCRDFLPPNVAQGLIEVVGIVDIKPMALEKAASILDLRYDQCYTDLGGRSGILCINASRRHVSRLGRYFSAFRRCRLSYERVTCATVIGSTHLARSPASVKRLGFKDKL